ncbi:MAG TPA: hypothetical protein VHD56_08745 [Tepidisphaeraceae bacterium]|nr:hypothetical protein [Tepidisphaeraceae bacterium]
MNTSPIICFGQQPCGIFPKRFLFAKFQTARKLQSEIGGQIVFFYHDSDHDPRETRTILRHRKSNEPFEINFTFDNKLQRKHSPLYLKRVRADWLEKTAIQLPAYADRRWVDAFKKIAASNVADFCLEMYRAMGLLNGMQIVRSSDAEFRRRACDISDYFVDVKHDGEIVRARLQNGKLVLHEGGDAFTMLPSCEYGKEQISPARDSRLRWMQSVIHCTHYVTGASEQDYLRKEDAPEIVYVKRETIDRSNEAYTDVPG